MSINGIGAKIAGLPISPSEHDKKRPGGHAASGESTRAPSADQVEISEAGRSLAREASPDLAEIRARVESGYYDTPAAAEATARRILASGDLGQS